MDPVADKRSAGFSLLEMMAVLAILAVLMTIATLSYVDWDRAEGMRGSVSGVRSALSEARQWAITRGAATGFIYGNTNYPPLRGYYMISNTVDGLVGQPNFLGKGVAFEVDEGAVWFAGNGAGGGPDSEWPGNVREIVITEDLRSTNAMTARIRVHRVTGVATGGEY